MPTTTLSRNSLQRRSEYQRRCGEQAGVALLITLAALVLLSAVVLAFLSLTQTHRQISFSSSGQNRAEILARTGIDTTMADFISEIQAGSLNGGYTSNSVTIYVPSTNFTAAPYRIVSTTYTNLVTESLGGYPFWTNTAPGFATTQPVPTRASSDSHYSTLTPSLNGRYIPASIWAKPQLLSSALPTPSWILITRGGPITNATMLPTMAAMASSAPGNKSYVIGRYAYAVYDEGGLIDVNVAGNGLSPTANAQRGRLNQAALGQIPLVDNTPGDNANTTAAFNLVTWRNPTASTDSANYLFNPTNTFMNVSTGYANQQAFTSRQDLINYFANNGLQTSALPYVGTFSRELDAPSFTPDPNRARVVTTNYYTTTWAGPTGSLSFNYGRGNPNTQGKDDVYNPSLANVRDSNGNTLIKNRFPLSRLAWLTYNGPIADSNGNLTAPAGLISQLNGAGFPNSYLAQGTPANILTYFGLVWDSTNHQWIYTSPEGSLSTPVAANIIKWLSYSSSPSFAIPTGSLKRAETTGPDFFEIIQAAIAVGSLGRDAGPPGPNNDPSSAGTTKTYPLASDANNYGVSSNVIVEDQNVYRHVLQIGANIIDQFDFDSYPTAIMMATATGTTTVYGVEDLPYPARLIASGVTDYDNKKTRNYLQVEMWNPHQQVTSTLNNYPMAFRVRPDPSTTSTVEITENKWHTVANPVLGSATNVVGNIQFPASGSATPTNYYYPTLLTKNNSSGGYYSPDQLSPGTTEFLRSYNSESGHNGPEVNPNFPYYGFYAGEYISSDANPTIAANDPTSYTTSNIPVYSSTSLRLHYTASYTNNPSPPGYPYHVIESYVEMIPVTGMSFIFEYTPDGSSWYPYSKIRNIEYCGCENDVAGSVPGSGTGGPGFGAVLVDTGKGGLMNDIHIDPRTDRFGMMVSYSSQKNLPLGIYYDPNFPQTFWHYYSSMPSTYVSPFTGNNVYYNGIGMFQPVSPAFHFTTFKGPQNTAAVAAEMLSDNVTNYSGSGASPAYYEDPDGVVRPAEGAYAIPPNTSATLNTTTTTSIYGRPMAMQAPYNNSVDTYSALPGPPAYTPIGYGTTNSPNNLQTPAAAVISSANMNGSSEPIVLNRPFHSVAELGYTFRDVPWKNLDFFTTSSGDAALLDAFSVDDPNVVLPPGLSATTFLATNAAPYSYGTGKYPVTAGKINLNTQNSLSLQAILAGAIMNEVSTASTNQISPAVAANIAQALIARTGSSAAGYGPLANKSELVSKFVGDIAKNTVYSTAPGDSIIKPRVESAVRALADVGAVRTWNLMIDMIVQAGKYPPTSITGDQFIVEGEKHYWLHVALDRSTGNIIDMYLEPVYD